MRAFSFCEVDMKHIVSFSGGAGSFATAKQVAKKVGLTDLVMVFCDTLIEDSDLYRFNYDVASHIYEIESSELKVLCYSVPEVYEEGRKEHLYKLAKCWNSVFGDKFPYLQNGMDIWDSFKKNSWVGNSRVAHCTTDLKGKEFMKWLKVSYQSDECVLHFGFDWAEAHRLETAKKNWSPYTCEAILCQTPFLSRQQIMQIIDDCEIDLPRLYDLGFSHNNCGGFCVKAGLKHFKLLFEKMPQVYAYHQAKYDALAAELPTAKPFLKKTVNKQQSYLTLGEYADMLKTNQQFDIFDDSNQCGCFSMYDPSQDVEFVNVKGLL